MTGISLTLRYVQWSDILPKRWGDLLNDLVEHRSQSHQSPLENSVNRFHITVMARVLFMKVLGSAVYARGRRSRGDHEGKGGRVILGKLWCPSIAADSHEECNKFGGGLCMYIRHGAVRKVIEHSREKYKEKLSVSSESVNVTQSTFSTESMPRSQNSVG